MRLFVGFFPPPEAISHASGAVDRISSTTPDVRWIPPERWHVTCVFLGEVPHSPRRLGAALDRALAGTPPVPGVRLAGSGTFHPRPRSPITAPAYGASRSGMAEGTAGPSREMNVAPGVLWLGIDQERAEFRAENAVGVKNPPEVGLPSLATDIRDAMGALGISVERRPWIPHLTIARWRPRGAEAGTGEPAEDAFASLERELGIPERP